MMNIDFGKIFKKNGKNSFILKSAKILSYVERRR